MKCVIAFREGTLVERTNSLTDRFPESNFGRMVPGPGSAAAEEVPELTIPALAESLGALIRRPSVNPGMAEVAIVEEIERQLAETACELTRVESMPGRPSLAAVLGKPGRGPALVLNGHMDTVAIDDPARWTVDPFGGEVRDGAVWGRGSVDMKGGLTAQIACAKPLSRMRDRLAGSLVLHFAAGEECGEPGTLSLIQNGFVGDWGITTEPTSLAVATAQRGTVWLRIRVVGRSTHAAAPRAGQNPIAAVETILAALRRYDAELAQRTHPLLGSPICTVTMLRGGAEHNAVPDSCELTVDRRLIPGETPATVESELNAVVSTAIAQHPGLTAELIPIHHPFEAAEVPSESQFVETVQRAVQQVTGTRGPVCGTPYGSDVRNLVNDAGMEAITFGAGDVAMCHCPDEHQSLEELQQATLVLVCVARELLTA
jgi:succinyl-diaminopimelate desuccinylase